MNIRMTATKKVNDITKVLMVTLCLLATMILPYSADAQDVNWDNEFEQGFTKFQEGNWAEAFVHLEKIANALPSLGADTDVKRTVYYLCGTCAEQIGELNKSINYNTKALELPNTPIEITIQLLGSQLRNYSELSMKGNCEKTIEQMMEIYKQHKHIDLVGPVMTYYLETGNFDKVIEFEKDLSSLIVPTAITEMDKISNTISWNTINMNLADSYMVLKEFDKALNYYEKSIATVTEYNKENLSLIYYSIARIYDLKGDKAEALKYQKLALESEL